MSDSSGLRCWFEALFVQLAASSADLVITELLSPPDELAQCCAEETEGTAGMTEGDVNTVTFSVLLSVTAVLLRTSPENTEDSNLVMAVGPPPTSSD